MWPSRGINFECPKPKCFNCQVTAESKICIKRHKCKLCKIPRQHSGTAICTKNWRCDVYAQKEENCQYMRKEYCTTCVIKKAKCANCKELHSKCTINGNFYILINLLDCCAYHLLSVQPDFVSQKCEIEESITKSTNGKYHLVM